MRYLVLILLAVFTTFSNLYSFDSKVWDNWYFGRRAAITFNTADREPIPLDDSVINTLEGCASISDEDGNLLFYTDGVYVFNKLGNIMPNGRDLRGHYSSTQSALIIKRPNSDRFYHIFTTDKGPYEGDSDHDFCMSVVDITLNEGLGDVVNKNYEIHKPVVEKLTAVLHKNGTDYWVIARGMNNNLFIVSLLTEGGIVNTRTIAVGPTYYPYPNTPQLSLGQLKANPKGDMLAEVVYGENLVELYKFDNETGEISQYIPISIEEEVTALYGVEFSPNNKFLYINNLYGRIYQFDVEDYSISNITSSLKVVYDNINYDFQTLGQMQLAPNSKIYLALSYDTSLAVIAKPNVPSPFCQFSYDDIGLNGNLSLFGLPNNVTTGSQNSVDVYAASLCRGLKDIDTIELFSIVYPTANYTYEWSGPNGFQSSLANPKIIGADFSNEGKYICRVYLNGAFFKSDSVDVFVYDAPKAEITGPNKICSPDIIKLRSKHNSNEYIYRWSTGETTSEISINSAGLYYLVISNPAGCVDSVSFRVENEDNLFVAFDSDDKFCTGTSLEISLDKRFYEPLRDYKFRWSNGDTSISTVVNSSGYYSVTITKNSGCSGTDSIYIEELENPSVELNLKGTIHICYGDSVLLAPEETNSRWNYQWTDDKNATINRFINKQGIYTLLVNNNGYCEDSASVEVLIGAKPDLSLNFDNVLNFCSGDSVIVQPKNIDNNFTYYWADGENNPLRVIKKSGRYKLYATSPIGCADSTEFEVSVAPEINLKIYADKQFLCAIDSATLSANYRYASYKWSSGDTTDFIRVYNAGTYTLIVTNELGCSDTAQIEISKAELDVVRNKNQILIDSICQNQDIIESVNLDYFSNDIIEIEDYIYKGSNFNFTIEEVFGEKSDNHIEQTLNIKVGKNKPGVYQGEIIIDINKPCSNRITIPIYVKIYSTYQFEANHIVAEAGDSVCIIINAEAKCVNDDDLSYAPEFDIMLKSDYFYPSYAVGGEILNNLSDGIDRTIRVKYAPQTFPLGTKRQIQICGVALTGQKVVDSIQIDNFNWNNNFIYTDVEKGSIAIEACIQELRALQSFTPINATISPKPASDYIDIKINSQEKGLHNIEIYSIEGRMLYRFEMDNFDINSSQVIQLNTSNFNQGMYQLVIKSPWSVLRDSFVIIKE